jgi:hypothetical protein
MADEDEFRKAAEAMAATVQVDPNATKRNELQGNVLRTALVAAQAKSHLLAASRGQTANLVGAQGAMSFRMAERDAQNALSTYIEWEAQVMS